MTHGKIDIKTVTSRYPWLSTFGALSLLTYLYVSTQAELISFYHLPPAVFEQSALILSIAVYAIIILIDARLFHRKAAIQQRQTIKLKQQINALLSARKKLQTKAHTSAGHADKLKLFISDRLLEHIEYDEKFLHFKNIASEVRHNGVICFDKVQTALKQAIDNTPQEGNETYQSALNSMIYLWDLLELSTTDNLALHIANQLYECEEHYYQMLLKDEGLTAELSPPTFSPQSALSKAINPFLEEPIDIAINDDTQNQSLVQSDSRIWVNIEPAKPLLGNENHIILLLENLINNALFFSNKRPYRYKHARTAVQLLNHNDNTRYSIYNHGPHISDADKDQIFQLGYSTRRVRENNGKGLGLYFVNEIIKGYEGSIGFRNISNSETIYSIRIAFSDNSVMTEVVETLLTEKGNDEGTHKGRDKTIKCQRGGDGKLNNAIEWECNKKIASIEVSTQQTFSFNIDDEKNHFFLDPEDSAMPRWSLEITQRKNTHKIVFAPLDINGVCFYVDLPSAESRLDCSDELTIDNSTGEQDIEQLQEKLHEKLSDNFGGLEAYK